MMHARLAFIYKIATVGACLMASCYNPSYQDAHYSCTQDGDCPTGYSCGSDKMCQLPTAAAGDMGRVVPPAPACTNGGTQVGGGVYACRGNFSPGGTGDMGDYTALCGSGLHVCTDGDQGALGTIDGDTCGKAGGFYAAHVTAFEGLDGKIYCGSPMFAFKFLVGCGSGEGSTTPGNTCVHLSTAIQCHDSKPPWTCTDDFTKILTDTTHAGTNGQGGVLCCQG